MVADKGDGICYDLDVAGLIDQIKPRLKPGFELEFFKGGKGKGMHRLLKNGQPYREKGLKYIVINDDDNYVYRRKQLSKLGQVGAIDYAEPQPKPKQRDAERLTNYAVPTKTAVEMAREILKDIKANPRERKMAKAYLDLVARYARAVKLAKRLTEKLDEARVKV